jgi:hypothetical protein
MRRSTVLYLPLQEGFPALGILTLSLTVSLKNLANVNARVHWRSLYVKMAEI